MINQRKLICVKDKQCIFGIAMSKQKKAVKVSIETCTLEAIQREICLDFSDS